MDLFREVLGADNHHFRHFHRQLFDILSKKQLISFLLDMFNVGVDLAAMGIFFRLFCFREEILNHRSASKAIKLKFH